MKWIWNTLKLRGNNLIAPFRKTSPLISPLHPLVAMIYIGIVRVGRIYLVGEQKSPAVVDFIGEQWVQVWASAMMLGGALAFIGVLRATITPATPRQGLALETLACVIILVTQLMYDYALMVSGSTAYHTTTLTETIGYAAGLRLIVNVFEFRKIRWQESQQALRIADEA